MEDGMDKNKDTGGAAFPLKEPLTSDSEGMSLRDYLAAKSLNGMLANALYDEFLGSGDFNQVVGRYAELAYMYADAMLLERAK
jgi:hypothetical protein